MFQRLCKRQKQSLDSGPSLHMRKKCSVCACLLTGQLQKAADNNLYSLKGFWSCCPVLRILEQTWWPYWAALMPSPLRWQWAGAASVKSIKHCSVAEWWAQSRPSVRLGMEIWEGSITGAWSKSKRNCSLHFRHPMAPSSCLGTCAQAVTGAENSNHSPDLSQVKQSCWCPLPSVPAQPQWLHTTAQFRHPRPPRKLLSPPQHSLLWDWVLKKPDPILNPGKFKCFEASHFEVRKGGKEGQGFRSHWGQGEASQDTFSWCGHRLPSQKCC